MRQRDKQAPQSAEEAVRDIRRATRRHFSAEEKIRIIVEGLRGEDSIAELCAKKASPRTSTTDGRKSFSKPVGLITSSKAQPTTRSTRRVRTSFGSATTSSGPAHTGTESHRTSPPDNLRAGTAAGLHRHRRSPFGKDAGV